MSISQGKEFSTQQNHLLSNAYVVSSIFRLSEGLPSLAVLTWLIKFIDDGAAAQDIPSDLRRLDKL